MGRSAGGGTRKQCCAVYTRKSSEEGLEQDFNSLDAQREACEAFIKSQKHEGWEVVPTLYDDGGISGATMERRALRRLLDDIGARKIDVVVVYKVDKLTRSLADFAKIVETFDNHDVSFVSVTQQFNTTSSMGRLTLNVLLSFAQFEREVTGERIRDKIAASKKKGMWMGGHPPLGYDAKDRKLEVNEAEAETVRHIFRRYMDLGSVRSLSHELHAEGIVSKVRVSEAGRRSGGVPLARGALYLMLQNRIYRGEIVHKDKHYPGQHEAIVDPALWGKVQALLARNRVERKNGHTARNPSLLAGLLFDGRGRAMTPSHAVKNGKRYRYYVSRHLTTRRKADVPGGLRIPAGDIERLVADRVRQALADEAMVLEAIGGRIKEPAEQKRFMERATALSETWDDLSPAEARAILLALITRIQVHAERIDIGVHAVRIPDVLVNDPMDLDASTEVREADCLTLSVPAQLKRAGLGTKMILDGEKGKDCKGGVDSSLVKLIVKAHTLQEKLLRSRGTSLSEIARREGVTRSYFTRLLRLTFLAPDITRAILEGRHPPELSAAKLKGASRLPLDWREQRNALGFK